MVSEIKLEFPEFITHIPVSKNKWVKIGYNKIHASVHYTTRAALVAAIHWYIEKHIPNNLTIKAPVETKLTVYAPVNYGVMKMIKDKVTGINASLDIDAHPAKKSSNGNKKIFFMDNTPL